MAPPEWIVWYPAGGEDGPDDGRHIRAHYAKSAAEEWGRQHEWRNCEYTLDSEPETVMICPSEDRTMIQSFRVRAETSRHYFADSVPLPAREVQP